MSIILDLKAKENIIFEDYINKTVTSFKGVKITWCKD